MLKFPGKYSVFFFSLCLFNFRFDVYCLMHLFPLLFWNAVNELWLLEITAQSSIYWSICENWISRVSCVWACSRLVVSYWNYYSCPLIFWMNAIPFICFVLYYQQPDRLSPFFFYFYFFYCYTFFGIHLLKYKLVLQMRKKFHSWNLGSESLSFLDCCHLVGVFFPFVSMVFEFGNRFDITFFFGTLQSCTIWIDFPVSIFVLSFSSWTPSSPSYCFVILVHLISILRCLHSFFAPSFSRTEMKSKTTRQPTTCSSFDDWIEEFKQSRARTRICFFCANQTMEKFPTSFPNLSPNPSYHRMRRKRCKCRSSLFSCFIKVQKRNKNCTIFNQYKTVKIRNELLHVKSIFCSSSTKHIHNESKISALKSDFHSMLSDRSNGRIQRNVVSL